jgi:hypothetical protein
MMNNHPNPLLDLDPARYGRTFVEHVQFLKWGGRQPDQREVAESLRACAEHHIKLTHKTRKPPERWALEAILRPLPPKKRGPKARINPADVRTLEARLRRYHAIPEESTQAAQHLLMKPYRPEVVQELVLLVRPLAPNNDEANDWVGEFLGLAGSRIKNIVKTAMSSSLRSVR